MDITIIFATYKRPQILANTLTSLCKLNSGSLQWELIVVDNAGHAATQEVVSQFNERLPLTFLIEQKPGKNNALNLAIPKAQGELLVFCDDDIIASENWLTEIWEGASRWPDHDVFGGKIVADWPDVLPYWGTDHSLNISLFALHEPYNKETSYKDGRVLPYGPNMAIRSKVFARGYKYNPDVGPTNKTIYKMGSETGYLEGYWQMVLSQFIYPSVLLAIRSGQSNFRQHG